MYEGKDVLVAGATGLIGANLTEALLKQGANVRGTLHRSPPVVDDKRIDYVKCDLTEEEDCERVVEGVDDVFLCAANTSGAKVIEDNPVAHVTDNLLINAQMLEAATFADVDRFLYISSSTTYPPAERPMREDEAFEGDPYEKYFGVSWMKRYTEKLAEFYHREYDLGACLVRPTNIYGPYDKFDFETAHVLPALIRRAVEGHDPFVVWGDGSAVRDFLYVEDFVDALLEVMEAKHDCDPVNVGSGDLVTIKECVEIIRELTEHDGTLEFDETKPTTIPYRAVDLTKLHEEVGWEAETPVREGLRRTIDWFESELHPMDEES